MRCWLSLRILALGIAALRVLLLRVAVLGVPVSRLLAIGRDLVLLRCCVCRRRGLLYALACGAHAWVSIALCHGGLGSVQPGNTQADADSNADGVPARHGRLRAMVETSIHARTASGAQGERHVAPGPVRRIIQGIGGKGGHL